MNAPLAMEREGQGWPGREYSRFVNAAGLRWHVQQSPDAGRGRPLLLLLHGTGASTHTWHGLWPLLAPKVDLLAVDLPGHAFTSTAAPEQLSLPGMAQALHALLKALALQPTHAVGHSAGAAILVRMALDGSLPARALFSINGAFLPFGGPAAPLLSPLARLLYASAWVPRLFASRAADPAVVERLVRGTGSHLDPQGLERYATLIRNPLHAQAALGMMAHWDLPPLARALPRLQVPLHLLVGQKDAAVPPSSGRRVHALCPRSTLTVLPGLGHLAHEEAPTAVATWMLQLLH